MENNIKDLIKIPETLDEAVLKGYKRGKSEKRKKLLFNKKTYVAAAVVIAAFGIGSLGLTTVGASLNSGNVFQYFKDGVYKKNLNKYVEIGNEVGVTVEEKGIKVTVEKVIMDDNTLLVSLAVKSDKLLGYDETNKPQDFLDGDFNIYVNGESPKSYNIKTNIIDQRTAAMILEADISDLNLDDEADLDLNIRNFRRGNKIIEKGKWNFALKVKKGTDNDTYEVNKVLALNNVNVNVEKLVITSLESKLYFKGNSKESVSINSNEFIVRDNNNNVLTVEQMRGMQDNEGDFEYNYRILNDLTNTEYIEIIRAKGNEPVMAEGGGYILKCSSSNGEKADLINEVISRKPSKKELKDGYALDKVTYNINIDKNTAFESIDNLIGKEISMNKNSKLIVKDIKDYDDYTEVVMKVNGSYDYNLLRSMVLFDEDMKDVSAFEGSQVTLDDIKEKIVSVRLNKIDTSKKYTIAIPEVSDLILNESEKIVIELNHK